MHPRTYDWMTHPIVLSLYREHGQRLNFAGVILQRIRFVTQVGKEVIARNATEVAEMLKADAAIITWIGGGNAFMDTMLTIQNLEQRGIKTVLVTYESAGPDGKDLPLLFSVPEAVAIVSTGNRSSPLDLPTPERVVGPSDQIRTDPSQPSHPARDPLTLSRDPYLGGTDNWGWDSWTSEEY